MLKINEREAMKSRRPAGKPPSVNGTPPAGGAGLLNVVLAPPSVTVTVCVLVLIAVVVRLLVPVCGVLAHVLPLAMDVASLALNRSTVMW